jgi:hypothetical protein
MLPQLSGCGYIIVSILLSFIERCASAVIQQLELLKNPIGNFVFDSSLGNPAPPITVWYYRPDEVERGQSQVILSD